MQGRLVLGLAGAGVLAAGATVVGLASARRDPGANVDAEGGAPPVPTPAAAPPNASPGAGFPQRNGPDYVADRPVPVRVGDTLDQAVQRYFSRYDHDGSDAIDLRPRRYDREIQEPHHVGARTAARLARSDERITAYRGDAFGDGLNLLAENDLMLLMAAAQRTPGRDLASLELRRPDLRAALAPYDRDGSDSFDGPELARLATDFPTQTANFRFVRVLHLGEWRGGGTS